MAKRGRKAQTYKIDDYFDNDKLLEITEGDQDAADQLRVYIESNFGMYARSAKKIKQLEKTLKEIYNDPANGAAMQTAKANWNGDRRKFNGVKVMTDSVAMNEMLDEKTEILEAALLSNGMYLTYQRIANPYDSKGSSPWYTYAFITAAQAASIKLDLRSQLED